MENIVEYTNKQKYEKYKQKGKGLQCSSDILDKGYNNRIDDFEIPVIKYFPTHNNARIIFDISTSNGNLLYTKLGSGSYGTVFLGSEIDGNNNIIKKVAIKVIPKINTGLQNTICREIVSVIKSKNITGILQYYGFSFDTTNNIDGTIYIFMEYFKGETLKKHIEKQQLSIDNEIFIASQLIKNLKNMHDNGLYHRDIKLSNVMVNLESGIPVTKYIDFGFSCINKICDKGIYGTEAYFSPETVFNGDIPCPKSNDLWALGITLCELVFGLEYTSENVSVNKFNKKTHKFEQVNLTNDIIDIYVMGGLRRMIDYLRTIYGNDNNVRYDILGEIILVILSLLQINPKDRKIIDTPKIDEFTKNYVPSA